MAQEITQSLFGLDRPIQQQTQQPGVEGILQGIRGSISGGLRRISGERTPQEVQLGKFKAITQQMQEQGIDIASPQGLTELGNRLTSAGLTGMGTAMMMQGRNQFVAEQKAEADILYKQAQVFQARNPKFSEIAFRNVVDEVATMNPGLTEREIQNKAAEIFARREHEKDKEIALIESNIGVDEKRIQAAIEINKKKLYEDKNSLYNRYQNGGSTAVTFYKDFLGAINKQFSSAIFRQDFLSLSQFAETIGVTLPEAASETEKVNIIVNRLVADKARLLPGNLAVKELELLKTAFGNNQVSIRTLRQVAKQIFADRLKDRIEYKMYETWKDGYEDDSVLPIDKYNIDKNSVKARKIQEKIFKIADDYESQDKGNILIDKDFVDDMINTYMGIK